MLAQQRFAAVKQRVHIAKQKAVIPQNIVQPFHIRHRAFNAIGQLGFAQIVQQLLAIAFENLHDDFVFVGKVVIKIARADVEMAGNMIGADAALAVFVEQH